MSDLDKNKEGFEENNKQSKNLDIKSQFLLDFKKNVWWKEINSRIDFFNKIDNSENISYELFWELESFENKNWASHILDSNWKKTNKYPWLDLKKISINDLKKTFQIDLLRFKRDRNDIKILIFSDYEIDENFYKNNILDKVSKKTLLQLSDLKKSQNTREQFLISILWKNNLPLPKNKISFFEKIEFLKEKSLSVEYEHREKLLNILQRLDSRDRTLWLWSMDLGAFSDLLNLNCLDISFKKKIIESYLPIISFKDIENLSFFKSIQNKLKKEIVKNSFTPLEINSIWEENIISEINWSDISFETSKISLTDSNILEITQSSILSNHISKNFIEDFNISFNKIKENISENWPQSLEELRQFLANPDFDWKIENLWNFKPGNIIKVINKDSEWNKIVSYGKITSISDLDKNIKIIWIWDNSTGKDIINFNISNSPEIFSYTDIIANFKQEWKLSIFYTQSKLQKIIDDPKSSISSSSLKQYNLEELNQDPELLNILKDQYKENISQEIKGLEKEIDLIQEDIKNIQDTQNNKNKTESKNRINILKIKLENIKITLSKKIEVKDSNIPIDDVIEYSNKMELIDKINLINPEWKDIELEAEWYIKTKDGIYKIVWIDWEEWFIKLESQWKKWTQSEKLSFESFYQAFKKNNAKRVKPISNLEDFLKENQENNENKDDWSDFIVKNWKLQINKLPEHSKDKSLDVEYLISDNSDSIYKIENISGDQITFKFWERKNINSLNEKDQVLCKDNLKIWKDWKPELLNWKPQYEWELLSINENSETISLVEFNTLINKNKKESFHPDWQTWKNKTISNPQGSENEISSSFLLKVIWGLSFGQMISGMKMLSENFEEYIKKWSDINAAKLALSLWRFLPDEIRADLLIKVERTESESMDKEIEGLWKVDSPVATKRISKWLLNKNTPQYKKEAWLMFMIKKYGHLNSKAFSGYAWKFLWYESFGWKIWDELFIGIQNEAKEKNQTFSEEYLMYILIKKQCWSDWYKWIKRRTKLHKEYSKNWEQWIEDEIKDGYDKADSERRADVIVESWIWELLSWNISNWIWWFKKAIERWGSLEEMNEGFFTLLYSGAIYNVDQKTYLKIKWLWDSEWMPTIMARFSSFKSDMDLFNNTVLEISKRIWDEYSDEFPNIKSEAKELFLDAQHQKWTEKSRLLRAQKFWKKYATPLSRALNMSHTWSSKYSKTDKILLLEQESNPIFKEYYNSVRWFTTEWTFKKDLMQDAMWAEWVAWLNTLENIKHYFRMDSGKSIPTTNMTVVEIIWHWISNDINSVKWNDLSKFDKKEYLKFILRDIFAWFISNHPDEIYIKKYIDISPLKDDLKKWWISKDVIIKFLEYSEHWIVSWNADLIISDISDFILSWDTSTDTSSSSLWDTFRSWFETSSDIKDKTDEILDIEE